MNRDFVLLVLKLSGQQEKPRLVDAYRIPGESFPHVPNALTHLLDYVPRRRSAEAQARPECESDGQRKRKEIPPEPVAAARSWVI
jgi:hypothetical protein